MKVVRTIRDARRELAELGVGRNVGLVPTMGALHEGHLSLLRAARDTCDVVVLSIFVNPLQFGPSEDLARYPRDEASDLAAAENVGVDAVFLPSVEEMYPPGTAVRVCPGPLGEVLEGAARPGHFDGVATVVTKLFNIVRPGAAFFGQKDAQQVAVVKAMVRDLDMGIDIHVCPIVREPDGLALSSRNVYLSADERAAALILSRALRRGAERLAEEGDVASAEREMWAMLDAQDGVVPDYAAVVDPDDMGPPRADGPILLAVAARVGTTRLIDNVLAGTEDGRA